MFPRRKLAALVLLAAAVGCTDHDPPSPTGPDAAGAGPEAAAAAPNASAEANRLERQARRLARALDDPAFRQYLQAQLRESPVVEHKLHFQRLLSRDGGRALGAMAKADGEAESAVLSDATAGLTAELYFPVPGHLERWDGGTNLLVATAIGDRDVPIAYDTRGRRVLLDPARPPDIPVLALVPLETNFDAPAGPQGAICDLVSCGGDGNGEGGGGSSGSGTGTTGGSLTPPSQSLYLTKAQFVDTFEGLRARGRLRVHSPASQTFGVEHVDGLWTLRQERWALAYSRRRQLAETASGYRIPEQIGGNHSL